MTRKRARNETKTETKVQDHTLNRRSILLGGTTLAAASTLGSGLPLGSLAQAQPLSTHWDELSKLPFKESYPTPEASARLYDELQFQRAVQVYLWALPA